MQRVPEQCSGTRFVFSAGISRGPNGCEKK